MSKKGDWVLLQNIILKPDQRAPQVPEDTKQVPLIQWVKGWLTQDAQMGQEASATTRTGRVIKGTLVEEAPAYHHSFGQFIPELLQVQESIKAAMWGEEEQA
ncbi:MAG: 2-amino-4-ketopentanoate thiolase [Clostridiales bacterium]|nr:2-amino-4-ketopentanoate thiolase [Clostridiales bacterium]